MNEKTYLDMLNELHDALNNDTAIPLKDKGQIMGALQNLFELLWQYSA